MHGITKVAERNHQAMAGFLTHLASMQETRGVCVLGSHARTGCRPNADEYSDFDVALFIDLEIDPFILQYEPTSFQSAIQPLLPDWLPNFKFVAPFSEFEQRLHSYEPLQINVHQFVLSYEQQDHIVWSEDRREAFLNTCEILYDPTGAVAELISIKTRKHCRTHVQRLNRNMAIIPVLIEHCVIKCARRRAFVDAQLALSETVDHLIESAYDLNERPLPHRKWRFAQLVDLPLLPPGFSFNLEAALVNGPSSTEGFIERASTLQRLCSEILRISQERGIVSCDVYSNFVTALNAGWQLKHRTAADLAIGSIKDQYEKMRDLQWNTRNFELWMP
ncbi:hypothetical protein SFHH103_04073 (plasmid) [Sinorhizobium fredii HH103]|uniref:Nucleotidyltransferase domain-containing protein n=1 Tax=Sinorhizobium fredii (strain HH103) TaxID=1117943 RepID=G9ABY4_SINF1|nr:hypothetical protein [Sinorhizobium fredii]CCE98563.1 hypothetical protein SFHH103_04073 [Sinorhizobium fredii HH103]